MPILKTTFNFKTCCAILPVIDGRAGGNDMNPKRSSIKGFSEFASIIHTLEVFTSIYREGYYVARKRV